MANRIFHGAPGSYKTSTALWFELLPALRAGRFVVTNIEGLKSLDEIQLSLNEKFPDSARLLRISTLNEQGCNLIASWFHWLPVGAFLIIDEIQNIYDASERSNFKELDRSSKLTTSESIRSFEYLPDDVKEYSISLLSQIQDDGYTDDLGLKERDSDGLLIYPFNLKDALMRHRKFNWDILACTPDITKVHGLYRSVAEVAVSHKSFDFVPLPYFQRRPRTHEHNALERGLRPAKGETIRKVKVPLQVFSLYKSTQTGRSNKSGVSKNPLKNGGVIAMGGFIVAVVLFLLGMRLYAAAPEKNSVNSASAVSVASVVAGSSVSASGTGAFASLSGGNAGHSPVVVDADFLTMMGIQHLFLTAVVDVRSIAQRGMKDGKPIVSHAWSHNYVFDLVGKDGQWSVDGHTLEQYGYKIDRVSDCSVRVSIGSVSRFAFCRPTADSGQITERSDVAKPALAGLFGSGAASEG